MRFFLRVLRWVPRFLLYMLTMYIGGGIIGALLYMGVGSLIVEHMTVRELAMKGLHDGSFMLGAVWGPGTSFVICVVQAHRRAQANSEAAAPAQGDAGESRA